jgi:Ca2+-binding RTX toxin-like protein
VTDFNAAADLILLDNAVFTRLAVGTLAAGAFRASAAGVATQADDRIIYDTDSGALWYDTNGSASGGAMRFATLDTGLALQAADFRIF